MVEIPSDLEIEPLTLDDGSLATISSLDETVLGFRREVDHRWLVSDRQGYLYFRAGKVVGYGYVGYRSGPFALLDASDFPAVLAHAESQAAHSGYSTFGVETPMINRRAVDYLLGRDFRLSPFIALFLCDKPLGRLENYLAVAPPFIL